MPNRMYVEAPLNKGARLGDAAQFLMAELDRVAAEANRVVTGDVQILEGSNAFEHILRIEADTKPR